MKKWEKIATVKERRGHLRTNIMVRARLIAEGGEIRGFIRNLSQSGAMFDAEHRLFAGQQVELACGTSMVPAEVAWIDQRRIGLSFPKPLPEDQVSQLTGQRQ